jgi:hypothetical protein
MRLRACLGIALPLLSACTTLPELVRIEVDGSTVELKRKPQPAAEVPEAEAGADAPER